jgi:hypothetical protein
LLKEGETVQVTITPSAPPPPPSPSVPEDEIIRRIQACNTYREWLEVTKLFPAD